MNIPEYPVKYESSFGPSVDIKSFIEKNRVATIDNTSKLFKMGGGFCSSSESWNLLSVKLFGGISSTVISEAFSYENFYKLIKEFGGKLAGGNFRHGDEHAIYVSEENKLVFFAALREKHLDVNAFYSFEGKNIDLISKINDFAETHKLLPEKLARPKIYFINRVAGGGFSAAPFDIKKEFINLYPKELKDISNILDEEGSGAIILHGSPGTGKSSLIALLSRQVYKKKFLYIPTNIVNQLDSPDFISFLFEYKDCVFILEDAESVIELRNGSTRNSALTTLLSMSDGILGGVLNQKFIITFNCEVDKIDKALLRAGRLKYFKEFKRISATEAEKIAKENNRELPKQQDYSLAEIFNGENKVEEEKVAKIGF